MGNERKTNIYRMRSEWKLGDISERDTNGREIVKLIIGDISVGKQIQEYFIEDIYSDVLDEVMQNTSLYDVTERIGTVPQVVIESNGTLIMHNPNVPKYLQEVKSALKCIDENYIYDAYIELRLNMNGKSKLQESTNILVNMIRHSTGVQYATPFIRTAIIQNIEEQYFSIKESDLRNWFRSLSYEELVQIAKEIMRLKATKSTKDEFLQECISESEDHKPIPIKDIENTFGKELLFRLINGTLRDRLSFRR